MDDALQIVERTGQRWFAAELNRHKGQLLLRQGHSEAAEELYRKALSIAEEQEAKLWELRAAASLARLRRDQGRRAEARDLLAPVYGWFTEGFDTARSERSKGAARRAGLSRLLITFDHRSGEDGAKAARRFGEPRVHVIGKLLVVGMNGVIAQNRQIDPKWIVVDDPVPECRAKTGPG